MQSKMNNLIKLAARLLLPLLLAPGLARQTRPASAAAPEPAQAVGQLQWAPVQLQQQHHNHHLHHQHQHQQQQQQQQQQHQQHQQQQPQPPPQLTLNHLQHFAHQRKLNNALDYNNATNHQELQPAANQRPHTLFIPTRRQYELIKSHPGSLGAVARALKMAIVECQYQMRNELWDCPINRFSIKPTEIFGTLMSRSFKETSFIQSLISSAIAHSVTRACTDSEISTCSKKQAAFGNGFAEDIEFGRSFAKRFMELTREWQSGGQQHLNIDLHGNQHPQLAYYGSSKLSDPNSIISGGGGGGGIGNNININNIEQQNLIQTAISAAAGQPGGQEPVWKEKQLRRLINDHNDDVGLWQVLNGMRRECKCHGLSGACTLHTCWLRLPPFREVANQLHASLDKALRIEMYAAKTSLSHHKSLTSRTTTTTATATKKSNKKRSSSSPQTAHALNGLGRPSASKATIGDFVDGAPNGRLHFDDPSMNRIVGGGGGGGGTNKNGRLTNNTATTITDNQNSLSGNNPNNEIENQSLREFPSISSSKRVTNNTMDNQLVSQTGTQNAIGGSAKGGYTNLVKKFPIARPMGYKYSVVAPDKFDLLYAEESPDFCVPSENYNIKGTEGRLCSENSKASNSCERLCCGRGHKTELREEKYKCECKFEFCCKLECKTCTRKKTLYKCL